MSNPNITGEGNTHTQKLRTTLPPVEVPENIKTSADSTVEAAVEPPVDQVKPPVEQIKPNQQHHDPKDTLDSVDPKVLATEAEKVVGRKLSRDEQIQFINNLEPELMDVFVNRVLQSVNERQQKPAAPKKPRYVTDFSTIHEKDVFNLEVPIQAIDQQIPEYLNVKLKDPNFEARWVATNSRRLGLAKSQGYSYVTKEDLGEGLHIDIDTDSAGHFIFIDVVLMKVPKSRYYAQIRANFVQAIQQTKPTALHDSMMQTIDTEIASAVDPDTKLPFGDTYRQYREAGTMKPYQPLAK